MTCQHDIMVYFARGSYHGSLTSVVALCVLSIVLCAIIGCLTKDSPMIATIEPVLRDTVDGNAVPDDRRTFRAPSPVNHSGQSSRQALPQGRNIFPT